MSLKALRHRFHIVINITLDFSPFISSTMAIIFYDIPSKLPGCAWSPNTWKIRFYLNYRRIHIEPNGSSTRISNHSLCFTPYHRPMFLYHLRGNHRRTLYLLYMIPQQGFT
ncbi:hypothetical protein CPB83DRAFT_786941 [Crepidotus variabilis]|uniref:Uncharacterized protein n=1 Tax=Crepidotus variabilis TaxID=179855 RepID=A0A9P6ELW7_9AGAR|nr:hypothetical protein CPB83DRAFT_786941 [Crepidotus variabilis]